MKFYVLLGRKERSIEKSHDPAVYKNLIKADIMNESVLTG